MASIYDLKPAFQNLLRPVVRWLAAHGVTANQVTVAAFVLSAAAGAAVALWPERKEVLLLLPAVLFIRMALNAVDGMLAREHGQASRLGAVLNELGDVLSDAVLYLPLAFVAGVSGWLVVPVVILAGATEFAGVLTKLEGGSRRYDGPMGKSDRAVVFGLLGVLGGFGVPLAPWVDPILGLVCVLLVLTVVNRVRRGLAETPAR
ncbi:MAG: CDP-alcohol phosphatidyltransferase family protein [Opitutales bacterium]|nr:CDP-alcohol phosphatidyltransferase family protein [Opitutales bacterium]